MSIFEKATRKKLRFATSKGLITTEDLWDLSLESLDNVAKRLNKEVKESAEESFIKKRSVASTNLQLSFDVVKHIIDVKLKEKEEKLLAVEKAQRKQLLTDLIQKKELSSLEEKTLDELKKELESID